MFRTILVPLDGSAFGEYALPLAQAIARRSDAKLLLAHVHHPVMPLVPHAMALIEAELDLEQRARERAYLEEIGQQLSDRGALAVDVALLETPVAPALHDCAVKRGVDLIVMTTHGRGPVSRIWLGSVADRLMRWAPMPVLLVRPSETGAPPDGSGAVRHILIPLDGSALSERILAPATALGRLLDARYTLLHVIEPLPAAHGTELYTTALSEPAQAKARASAEAYLERVAGRLRDEGMPVETTVAVGMPAASILEYTQAHGVDLIAMETHGRGGIARWFMGSVADKVARGAAVAVLLQRPDGEAEAG